MMIISINDKKDACMNMLTKETIVGPNSMALQALVIQHEDRNYLIGGKGSGSILQIAIIKLPRSELWPSSGLRNLEILSILTRS